MKTAMISKERFKYEFALPSPLRRILPNKMLLL
jgi:hypothetical protein